MSSRSYFKALMRSAGPAPGAGVRRALEPMAVAASPEVFDPFEAAESVEAADESPRLPVGNSPANSPPGDLSIHPQAMPAAPTSARPNETLPAALARDAHPAVQAALRWVTGPTEPVAEPAIRRSIADTAAPRSIDPKAAEDRPPSRPADPPTITRIEHINTQADRPETAIPSPAPEPRAERPATADPAPAAHPKPHASHAALTTAPTRPHKPEPAERAPANTRAEVHIGTLHVTLDSAATARFATRTIAAPAPEAPRPATPGNTRQPSRQSSHSSSLSRSRLPRW